LNKTNLSKEDILMINSMIDDLKYLERNSLSGAVPDDLKRTATALREVKDGRLAQIWAKAGFKRKPEIQNTFINTEILTKGCYAIVFNAIDHKPENPDAEVYTGHQGMVPKILDINGKKISGPGIADLQYRSDNQQVNAWDVFTDKYLPIDKYFNKAVFYHYGTVINRHDIVNFVSYYRWAIHYGQSTKLPPEKVALLTDFIDVQEVNRDTIWTLYLGIVQNLFKSEDIKKFMSWKPH
jgi:hypothetical protein